MNKEDFFKNIRRRLNRNESGNTTSYPKGPPSFYNEEKFSIEEKLDLFKNNLEAVKGTCIIVKNKEELQGELYNIFLKNNVRKISQWDDPFLADLKIDEIGDSVGARVNVWSNKISKEANTDLVKSADIGITTVDVAIAFTGTITLLPNEKKRTSRKFVTANSCCYIYYGAACF